MFLTIYDLGRLMMATKSIQVNIDIVFVRTWLCQHEGVTLNLSRTDYFYKSSLYSEFSAAKIQRLLFQSMQTESNHARYGRDRSGRAMHHAAFFGTLGVNDIPGVAHLPREVDVYVNSFALAAKFIHMYRQTLLLLMECYTCITYECKKHSTRQPSWYLWNQCSLRAVWDDAVEDFLSEHHFLRGYDREELRQSKDHIVVRRTHRNYIRLEYKKKQRGQIKLRPGDWMQMSHLMKNDISHLHTPLFRKRTWS